MVESHKLVTSTAIFGTHYFQSTLQEERTGLHCEQIQCNKYDFDPQSLSAVYRKTINLFNSSLKKKEKKKKELFLCLYFMYFPFNSFANYSTGSLLSTDTHFKCLFLPGKHTLLKFLVYQFIFIVYSVQRYVCHLYSCCCNHFPVKFSDFHIWLCQSPRPLISMGFEQFFLQAKILPIVTSCICCWMYLSHRFYKY